MVEGTLVPQIQTEDWFVTIYLKDEYFCIQIVQRHRNFLRLDLTSFVFSQLALALLIFMKCMKHAGSKLL